MDVEVKLQVSGLDLASQAAAAALGEEFADTLVEKLEDTVGYITIFVDEEDVVGTAVRRVNALRAALPAAKIEKVDRDLVGITEIACRVGVSREAVRKWSKQEDFPTPTTVLGGDELRRQYLWAWAEILPWLRIARGLELDENPASVKDLVAIEDYLVGNTSLSGASWQKLTPPAALSRRTTIRAHAGTGSLTFNTASASRGGAQSRGSGWVHGTERRRDLAVIGSF